MGRHDRMNAGTCQQYGANGDREIRVQVDVMIPSGET
jgi:hypothetical protein